MDIADGKVLTECKHHHRNQECLSSLKRVEENVPRQIDLHVVVDNYDTHKHATVKRWMALSPLWHVHYVPTYASWLNQGEIWFKIITQKAIHRGSFKSVKDLIVKIDHYVRAYNIHAHAFA